MPRNKLITQNQVLKSLKIINLRGIKDLEIDFSGSPVTGIFGMNGSGKTTIIQTILCLFRAKNEENTKMSRFFKYTSGNKWIGSEYYAIVDYLQLSGKKRTIVTDRIIKYSKLKSEWSPRQAQKPDREVIFIPLSQCIPDIEKVSDKRVTFTPITGETIDEQISSAASQIMGVKYEELKISKIDRLSCYTVKRNDIECHSFNLGAGEQRLFRILQTLYRAQPYSLIVIDELDLTLHAAALKLLIKIMLQEAERPERNLQIVFTSHRQELMKSPIYNVRYIINTNSRTFCLEDPTEDCYEQLSGDSEKYLKIYVEDDLAQAIVHRCLKECGMYKHAQVCRFGSITNSIRLALGLACQEDNLDMLDDIVFFNDGDVVDYVEEGKKRKIMEATLSGSEKYLQNRRDKALQIMKHFTPPKEEERFLRPEEYIHKTLDTLSMDACKYPELLRDSKGIRDVANHHDYINLLLEKGYELTEIVELFASTSQWETYVNDVKEWINNRKIVHGVGKYSEIN